MPGTAELNRSRGSTNTIRASAIGLALSMSSAIALVLVDQVFDSTRHAAFFATTWSLSQICAVGLGFGTARYRLHRRQWAWRTPVIGAGAAVTMMCFLSFPSGGPPSMPVLAITTVAAAAMTMTSPRIEQFRLEGHHIAGAIVAASGRLAALGTAAVAAVTVPHGDLGPALAIGGGSVAMVACASILHLANGNRSPGKTTGIGSTSHREDPARWAGFVSAGLASTMLNFGPTVLFGLLGADEDTTIAIFVLGRLGQLVTLPALVIATRTATEAARYPDADRPSADMHQLQSELSRQVSIASLIAAGTVALCALGLPAVGIRTLGTATAILGLAGYWIGVATGPAAQLISFWRTPWEVTAADLAAVLAMGLGALAIQASSRMDGTSAAALSVSAAIAGRNVLLAMRAERLFDLRTAHPLPVWSTRAQEVPH